MKISLFDFQTDALAELHTKLKTAGAFAAIGNPQAISFSAPTGAGKTIVMTALFENILFGAEDFPAQHDAVILWISDMPELNEQTRLKIEGKSDRIRVRQLVTIDASFDAERLESGGIHFINTQKLGSDKRLTREGDGRRYPIWETFSNTARAVPDRFYVVIDEAHRGMRSGDGSRTIMQRFLLGSEAHDLCRMPLVLGISATPRRFEELLSGTTHTVHKVYVPPAQVRESGLLKDRIVIHYPDADTRAEMGLLAEAARRWQRMTARWAAYCKQEQETTVWPILVVQVEDGSSNTLTRTDLSTVLGTIEAAIERRLREGEVVHTFNDSGDLDINGHRVRNVEASRIEEDREIGVVLFKMSLSTGWDCPRAEVMMSFRRAVDHTFIAQLLGRMVRSPLARRIERDAALNDVHLLLPHYDQAAIANVIADLDNAEDVPPAKAGTHRQLITLSRRDGTEAIFEALRDRVTYRVNAVRQQSALRRLMGLGRALTHDTIDEDAQNTVKTRIIEHLNQALQQLKEAGRFAEPARRITQVELKSVAVQHGTRQMEDSADYEVEAASADIEQRFQQAGRLLGNGLHMDYWRAHAERDADSVKVEVIVLTDDHNLMRAMGSFAEQEFNRLYEQHQHAINQLREQRRRQYEKLRLATTVPAAIAWHLPEVIDFRREPEASFFDRHLYVDDNGRFQTELGTWEREILEQELKDDTVIGWLRNLDRKAWSLEIPYEVAGVPRPMFPDLLIVRQVDEQLRFDILEPHDPGRDDNHAKAVGLARFAERHGHLFDRIQLIRKRSSPAGGRRYSRLDINRVSVRPKVLAVTGNLQLDRVFEEYAD